MQSYNKFFKFASVRVFFLPKIEFILLFYAPRWLWMLAYGRHLGAYFFLLAFFLSSFYLAFLPARVFFLSSFYLAFRPARVLSFVLLSRVSSCSRSFFRPFISRFFLLAFIFFPARVLFLPARVLSFVLLSRVFSCSRSFFRPFISRSFFSFFLLAFFFPARVLSFVLLAFFLFSSCSRSFFRPFISRSFFHPFVSRSFFSFFLLAFFLSSFCLAFRPFISRSFFSFFLLEFIFLNKSPSKICIYQKIVVPLHSNLNILVRD